MSLNKYGAAAATALVGLALAACDKSTSTNPATVTRDELNPPSGLSSTTGDAQLILHWLAKNAEDDFKGYHVFAFPCAAGDDTVDKCVGSLGTAAYPTGADITHGEEIPRCKDNSPIFEKFGLEASTADCEGAAEKPDSASGTSSLMDDTAAGAGGESDPAEVIKTISLCDEGKGDTSISLPIATPPALGTQTCTIHKDYKGNTLADGTTYAVFVTAVMGDDKNQMSWTSNFISDTPHMVVYNKTLSVAAGSYYMFDAKDLTTPTAITTDPAATTCTADTCDVNNANTESTAGIYIGRDGGTLVSNGKPNLYEQRAFLSVPGGASATIKILDRGPQVFDSTNSDQFATSIPGDEADTTAGDYDSSGTLYQLTGDQVFDIAVTASGGTLYGKIVIGQVALTPDDSSVTNALSVPVTIMLDPTTGDGDI